MPNVNFLDTNVLIYAATARTEAPAKFERATQVMMMPNVCLSAQVLQEFYANVIRKPKPPLTPPQAQAWIDRLVVLPCADVDARLVRLAITLSQRWRISYWDAAILAAAERLGAKVVHTEDLNHGQTYGSIRVENPFLAA